MSDTEIRVYIAPLEVFYRDWAYIAPLEVFYRDWAYIAPLEVFYRDWAYIAPLEVFYRDWAYIAPLEVFYRDWAYIAPLEVFYRDWAYIAPLEVFLFLFNGRVKRKEVFDHVHRAKIHISLCIYTVWSESSLCALWVAIDPKLLHADKESWILTKFVYKLIRDFAECTCLKAHFRLSRLNIIIQYCLSIDWPLHSTTYGTDEVLWSF